MGESLTTHIEGDENPSDLLTKVLSGGKQRDFVISILHDMYYGKCKLHVVVE